MIFDKNSPKNFKNQIGALKVLGTLKAPELEDPIRRLPDWQLENYLCLIGHWSSH